MTGFIFAFTALTLAQLPLSGSYVVVQDSIEAVPGEWGGFCGVPTLKERTSKGQTLQITTHGDDWMAKGKGRRFGSNTCEGRNLSLEIQSKGEKNGKTIFKCASTRVVMGTEETEHEAFLNPVDKTVYFQTSSIRSFRKNGDLCELRVRRVTELQYIEPKIQPEAAISEKSCNVVSEPKKLQFYGEENLFVEKGKKTCFDVKALDSNGCTVEWAPIRWRVSPKSVGRINKRGCFRGSTNTRRTKARIWAKSGVHQISFPIKLVHASNRKRERIPSTPVKMTTTPSNQELDGGLPATPQEALLPPAILAEKEAPTLPKALRSSKSSEGQPIWLGLLIFCIALITWPLIRIYKPKKKGSLDAQDLEELEHRKIAPFILPTPVPKTKRLSAVRRRKVSGRILRNEKSGTLLPSPKKIHPPATDFDSDLGPAPLHEYCPECGRHYPPTGKAKCPIDGELLEPLSPLVPKQFHSLHIKSRICNVCFDEFEPNIYFCPNDEARLMVNLGQWDELKMNIRKKNGLIMNQRRRDVG